MSDHHGHAHSHGHSPEDWGDWRTATTLRYVVALVAVCAAATAIGIVALWPSSAGRDAAVTAASEIGLVTDRFSATVIEVEDLLCDYLVDQLPQQCRIVAVALNEGPNAGQTVYLPEFNLTINRSAPDIGVGDKIVVGFEPTTDYYFYADRDRRISLMWLGALFAVIVVGFGRLRGLLALVAMASTLVVLISFVGPSVLDGNDPVAVSIVAAAAIALVSLYLTHGVTPTTTVALAGTLSALAVTFGLSWAFFEIAQFGGFATEEGLILPFVSDDINLSGLLLGGAVLGALGALDDVTVTQVATVAEIRRHNPTLSTTELMASGIRVGRDHIASTVNTLLLAYAGASMPLLLLFAVSDQSLVMIANSEIIAVEIVRTLCGSIGLIAAVPITTALAAAVLRPRDPQAPADAPIEAAPQPPRWEDFAPDETI